MMLARGPFYLCTPPRTSSLRPRREEVRRPPREERDARYPDLPQLRHLDRLEGSAGALLHEVVP